MKSSTYSAKAKDIERHWHLFDAQGQVLGRLSSDVSRLLIGKDKVYYSPNLDCGDFVVVLNAKKVAVTGNKEIDKKYYRHSGYPGGFKEKRLEEVRSLQPERIIREAVSGMLPKNRLRAQRLARLKVYANESHPHGNHFVKEAK